MPSPSELTREEWFAFHRNHQPSAEWFNDDNCPLQEALTKATCPSCGESILRADLPVTIPDPDEDDDEDEDDPDRTPEFE